MSDVVVVTTKAAGCPTGSSKMRPPLHREIEDRKRQTAPTLVWVQVTQGELVLAPRPILNQLHPSAQRAWWIRTRDTYGRLASGRPTPHGRDLSNVLAAYAASTESMWAASALRCLAGGPLCPISTSRARLPAKSPNILQTHNRSAVVRRQITGELAP
jgi:hypothetical protein